MKNIFGTAIIVGSFVGLSACSTLQGPQPLPPIKVITETVALEIYQPPLPQEIKMQNIQWSVITNTPCKPATAKHKLGYYTTEIYQYEDVYVVDEQGKATGETKRELVRDANEQRVAMEQIKDEHGNVIQVCGNLDQKIAEVKKELGGEFVIMSVTPTGYENMAFNLQEIKRYIKQQKEIVLYYREATGANKSDDKEDWINKNNENQADQVGDVDASNEAIQATTTAPNNDGFLSRFNPFRKD